MPLSAKTIRKQLAILQPLMGSLSLKTIRRGQNKIGELMESRCRGQVMGKDHHFGNFSRAWVMPRDQRREGVILYLHGGGYTCGGLEYAKGFASTLAVGYVGVVLPRWWRNPNPVIFVPCTFLAAGLYLLFINLVTGGEWFLSFAFPVTCGVGVIVTTVVTLLRYLRGGKLFILGGAILAIGGWMLLVEYFMTITFPGVSFIGWSMYPMITLVLLGGYLIFLGICTPAREIMERKFFI